MQDKRCKYKIRECKDFYLFIKHKESHIYYAKFPEYNKIASTGKTNIKQAYQEAYRIYGSLGIATTPFHELLLNTYKDSYYKTYNMAKKLSGLLSDIKTLEQVTLQRLVKLQQQLLATGMSGKSVNNYMSLLRKLWKNKEYNPFQNLSPMKHTKTIRQCFPIESFKEYGNHIYQHKYFLLPYIAITTGMRTGEFKTAEPVIIHNRLYLQINGTKTENAVRRVPIISKVADAFLHYKSNGFAKAAWKESVYMAGSLVGYDKEYVDKHNIVFHSFRKMYKTILESNNINNLWIEYYMGHSILQSSDVNKLYFNPLAADDSLIYEQVLKALEFLS